MLSQYKLRSELHLHSSDVRAVASSPDGEYLATASRDNTIGIWVLDEKDQYTIKKVLRGHSHFVNAVSFLEAGQALLLVSGSADKSIRIWDVESDEKGGSNDDGALCKVEGHDNAVCDVIGWEGGFASASWDGTARTWEVLQGGKGVRCVNVLKGHEAAVWCVLPLNGQGFVTGGADKAQRVWDGHGKCTGVLKGHVDVVRGMCKGPDGGFISVANDSAEVFWKRNATGFSADRIIDGLHDGSFAYRVASREDNGDWKVASAGEDNMVRIVYVSGSKDDYKCAQTLAHPGTVWDVDILSNGDILSACSDGTARLFTKKESLVADAEAMKAYEEAISARQVSSKLVGGIDVSKLQDADEALAVPGNKEGEQKIVRRGKGAEVYLWSAGESKWSKVGDVVDDPNSASSGVGPGELNGKKYDFLFDVEVGEGGTYKKLGYDRGENPYVAAQRFIDDNELNQDFLDQIAKHIETQVGPEAMMEVDSGGADPLTGGSRYVPSGLNGAGNFVDGSPLTEGRYRPGAGMSSSTSARSSPPMKKLIPHRHGMTTFTSSDQLTKIQGKVLELNKSASPNLDDDEIKMFETLLIPHISSKGSVVLDDAECAIVEKMVKWPTSMVFPAIDIARLVVGQPSGGSYLFGKRNGAILDDILGHMKSEEVKAPVLLMGCRFLCNMFGNSVTSSVVRSRCKEILEACEKATTSDNVRVRSTFASVLVNYAVLFHDSKASFVEREPALKVAVQLVTSVEKGEEILFRLTVAMGTLMADDDESAMKGVELGAAVAAASAASKSKRLQDAALDISTLIAK